MAAHPRSAAKKSTGFYEELKETFGDDRRTKRSAKKKGEAALRQSDDLFEIEIVERDPMQKKIKVHFIGYGSEDDEWQDCSGDNRPVMKFVPLPTPSQSSLDERYSTFCDSLARKIKFSLFITKRVNPDTLISIEVDSDIMPLILSNVKHSEITRGRTTCYSVSNNRDLDVLFREGWDYRIENLQGDFSYVTQGTVSFYLKKVKPFLEYKIVGNTPVQCWISRRSLFNFNFVRKEGTKCQFEAGNWMA